MAKTLVAALCALVLLGTIIATISDAKAGGRTWHRSGTVKGPWGGTTTFQRYGACQGAPAFVVAPRSDPAAA